VFSEETDRAQDRYLRVRGASADIEKLKPFLIGARVTENGFEGLCERDPSLESAEVIEISRPSLEDIIVY
jgi:hypothetical protein